MNTNRSIMIQFRMRHAFSVLLSACLGLAFPAAGSAQEHDLRTFQRLKLSGEYYCEGANFGDFNRDGHRDIVAGPYWHAGPEFVEKHEIYEPKPQNRSFYADNFFSWVRDFNGDGWDDVLVVGFPGTAAFWYENPQSDDRHWTRHEALDWVSNESPHFTQLVGDDRPELICTRRGQFGFATVDWEHPTAPWTFHAISAAVAPVKFGHGLGVGDVDGDSRLDVLCKDGWYQQPETAPETRAWTFHPFVFTKAGGAQMFAYDVDGDGDNDVITSLAAHDHGLAWFEQKRPEDGVITFEQHLIMGNARRDNPYGVVFSELHALDLRDMDGDGLKDIVTGKTYWSHHTQTGSWHDGAVVYWFKLARRNGGAEFIPWRADDDSGVGRQVVCGDVNGDGLPDIVSANMQGTFVLLQRRENVSPAVWNEARPKPYRRPRSVSPTDAKLPLGAGGRELNTDFETGDLTDWRAEGTAFDGQPVKGEIRPDRRFGAGKKARPKGQYWIGGFEVQESDEATGTLTSLPFPVIQPYASYRIGGGAHPETRMELVLAQTGRVIFQTHGRHSETMAPETVDLSRYLGKTIFIRLVDQHSRGFGHLNFDDFRFHRRPPYFEDAVNMMKIARDGI